MVGETWHPGFTCYGVEIGSPGFVKHMLRQRLMRLEGEIDNIMSLLKNDKQAAWVVLSSSLAHTLDYTLTLQYPSDVLEAAAQLDAKLWISLEQLAGQPRIPRGDEGLGFECIVARETGVAALAGKSYQSLSSWVAWGCAPMLNPDWQPLLVELKWHCHTWWKATMEKKSSAPSWQKSLAEPALE